MGRVVLALECFVVAGLLHDGIFARLGEVDGQVEVGRSYRDNLCMMSSGGSGNSCVEH